MHFIRDGETKGEGHVTLRSVFTQSTRRRLGKHKKEWKDLQRHQLHKQRYQACDQVNTADLIVAAIREAFETGRNQLVQEIRLENAPSIEAAVKRVFAGVTEKTKNAINKGNRERYEANEEVIDTIEDALDELDREDLEAAKRTIEEAKKKLLKQQRMVKMADREENGWEAVRRYVSDDLGSESDKEKAIKTARRKASASKKRKSERQPLGGSGSVKGEDSSDKNNKSGKTVH